MPRPRSFVDERGVTRTIEYIVSVNGVWLGKNVDYGSGRGFSPYHYPTKTQAIRIAKNQGGKPVASVIEVHETWGSGPEQRKVVWHKVM